MLSTPIEKGARSSDPACRHFYCKVFDWIHRVSWWVGWMAGWSVCREVIHCDLFGVDSITEFRDWRLFALQPFATPSPKFGNNTPTMANQRTLSTQPATSTVDLFGLGNLHKKSKIYLVEYYITKENETLSFMASNLNKKS